MPAGGDGRQLGDPAHPRPDRAGVRATFGRWWNVVSGGRFFTRWSALVTFPIALTVLGVYSRIHSVDELPLLIAVSALSWVIQVVLILPGAWAERRLSSPAVRAGLVLAVVVVVSGVRPPINDLLLGWLNPALVIGNLGTRIGTNVIGGVLLLSLVAVTVDAVDSATGVTRRLREAMSALAGSPAAGEPAMRAAREQIVLAVGALRNRAAALLGRTVVVDFDRVRGYSEEVRARSHELEVRAGSAELQHPPRTPLAARLAPPPVGLVGLLCLLASVPYALHTMAAPMLLCLGGILLVLPSCGDLLTRRLIRGRSPRSRGLVLLAVPAVTAAVVTVLMLLVSRDLVVIIVFPTMLLLNALIAVAEGAVLRARLEGRWLTQALTAYRGSSTVSPQTPAELLHAAATVLHGEVQGRCVVFAASLEDDPATPAQTAQFVSSVYRALDHAVVPQTVTRDEDPFAALLSAWSHVLEIDCEIDDTAADALRDRARAREVADVVSEAFVNAVKHSAAREATVELRRSGSPQHPSLEVEVAAPGRLRDARSGRGQGLSRLPGAPRLTQRGSDVVLTAAVPLAPA